MDFTAGHSSHLIMKQANGLALISALLVMAVVAILSTAMSQRMAVSLQNTQLAITENKMAFARESMIHWAVATLRSHIRDQAYTPINRIQAPIQALNDIRIEATLEDAQQYFNVNNLIRTHGTQHQMKPDPILFAFSQLVLDRLPNLSQASALALTIAIATHLKQSSKSVAVNSHAKLTLESLLKHFKRSTTFLSRKQPLITSVNLANLDLNALRNVPGMTESYYQKLAPWLTALPSFTPININTASRPILITLNAEISPQSADAMLAVRQRHPFFSSVSQFLSNAEIRHAGCQPPFRLPLTVSSQYFHLNLHLRTEKQDQRWQLLFLHDTSQKRPRIYLLNQARVHRNAATAHTPFINKT